MARRPTTSWILFGITWMIAGAFPGSAQVVEEGETSHTLRGTVKPCVLEGLVSPAMADWFTIDIEDPPPGKKDCVLFRPVDKVVQGIIRLKSVDDTLPKYQQDPYQKLLDDNRAELADMAVEVGPVTKKDENMPVGSPFTEARIYAQDGKLGNHPAGQSVWTVIFRAPGYFYVVNMISPSEEDGPDQFQVNRVAFQRLLTSFHPPETES